jgi:transcriptional regulator with XRE-family HTH domain
MERLGEVTVHVGTHVRALRTARKWSRERLAQQLAALGCPINQNSIWKLEQVPPTRTITADELVALAMVFETTPHQLLGWPPVRAQLPTDDVQPTPAEITRAWAEYMRLGSAIDVAVTALSEASVRDESINAEASLVVALHRKREIVRARLDDMARACGSEVPRG